MRRPAPFDADCADSAAAHRGDHRAPRTNLAELQDASASDPDRTASGPSPARTDRSRPGWRDDRDCLRSWSAGLRGSRPAGPMATPPSVIAVAKNSGLPGISSSGWRTYGTISSLRLHRAGGDAGQRHRRAHQLQEAAAADRVEPLRRVARELAVQVVLELGRLGDFFEAAPHLRRRPAASLRANGRRDRSARPCCGARACDRVFWPSAALVFFISVIGGTPSSSSSVPCRRSCIRARAARRARPAPPPARIPSS